MCLKCEFKGRHVGRYWHKGIKISILLVTLLGAVDLHGQTVGATTHAAVQASKNPGDELNKDLPHWMKFTIEVRDRGVGEKAAKTESRQDDGESLLLLGGPDDRRMAMPLSLVARLEEFAPSAVEKAEGRHVVQYRGQILPLIHLSSALTERRQEPRSARPSAPGAEDEKIQVVVYTDQGRSVGLVVDRILDIAHEGVKMQKHSGRRGTLGAMVVQGRVTELLDLKGIILTADPNFYDEVVAA